MCNFLYSSKLHIEEYKEKMNKIINIFLFLSFSKVFISNKRKEKENKMRNMLPIKLKKQKEKSFRQLKFLLTVGFLYITKKIVKEREKQRNSPDFDRVYFFLETFHYK